MNPRDPAPREPVRFHAASPILRVENLVTSLAYYQERLGFTRDWYQPGVIASVSRGPANLLLCQGDQGHTGTWVYIGVGDVVRLHAELVSRGATLRQAPTDFPWAREIQVSDPDGNVIRFGSAPVPGAPRGGWLDMHGRLWPPPGGSGTPA